MVGLEVFIFGLLITSTLTGLSTEAVKTIMNEHEKTYCSNTITGFISVVISLLIGIGYLLLEGVGFTTQYIVYLVALIFMSWLCAMVGYDKVIQTISQFKTYGKGE